MAENFAYSPQWLAMLHYQKGWFGYKGTIVSDNFYLSPEGRTNPQKEFEAAIDLFQSDDVVRQCRFPARYILLKNNGYVTNDFPHCDEYEQFIADLQPQGATLLFTDAYMNNASSLFGHTLLRIDTNRSGGQLIAHGVNYGAYTQGYENSVLYALYGLMGFYPAGFTTKPYYNVINTYNNIENRDIWEYQLNLSDEELNLLVAHIWEAGQSTTPYYFFTINCSYALMEILDAVRPELKLADEFRFYTIPLDTIKAVNKRTDFVKSVNYRPSRQRKINYRIRQMNKAQYQTFLQIVKDKNYDMSNLPPDEQADVLETAYQYSQYRYVAKKSTLEEFRKESFTLLKGRNLVPQGQKFTEQPTGENPVDSHNSARVSIGLGVRNSHAFQEFGLRPAYHSLTDRKFGYLPGIEINFLDFYVRHYDAKNQYVLQKLDILQLESLSPLTDIFQAPSYQINVEIERDDYYGLDKSGYLFKGDVAGGAAYMPFSNTMIYAMSVLEGAYGGYLPDNQWIGTGLKGGIIVQNDKFTFRVDLRKIWASQSMGTKFLWKTSVDYYLAQNLALEASYQHTDRRGKHTNENIINLKYFL